MEKTCVVLTAIAIMALLYILWCLAEPFFLDMNRIILKSSPEDNTPADKLKVEKLPLIRNCSGPEPDFRFFFFSDIHAEWCPVTAGRICKEIRKAHAGKKLDGVIFGGDIITHTLNAAHGYKYLSAVSKCCRELNIPFYGISGNHDTALENAPEHSGFIDMDNKVLYLVSSTTSRRVILAGIPDSGTRKLSWSEIPAHEGTDPVILLSHDPDSILHLSPETRPEFMLSGHLHGGQMKFPFRIEFRILRKKDRLPQMGAVQGVYNIGGTTVFISRGVGCGVMPFRFLSSPEATITEFYL